MCQSTARTALHYICSALVRPFDVCDGTIRFSYKVSQSFEVVLVCVNILRVTCL